MLLSLVALQSIPNTRFTMSTDCFVGVFYCGIYNRIKVCEPLGGHIWHLGEWLVVACIDTLLVITSSVVCVALESILHLSRVFHFPANTHHLMLF